MNTTLAPTPAVDRQKPVFVRAISTEIGHEGQHLATNKLAQYKHIPNDEFAAFLTNEGKTWRAFRLEEHN